MKYNEVNLLNRNKFPLIFNNSNDYKSIETKINQREFQIKNHLDELDKLNSEYEIKPKRGLLKRKTRSKKDSYKSNLMYKMENYSNRLPKKIKLKIMNISPKSLSPSKRKTINYIKEGLHPENFDRLNKFTYNSPTKTEPNIGFLSGTVYYRNNDNKFNLSTNFKTISTNNFLNTFSTFQNSFVNNKSITDKIQDNYIKKKVISENKIKLKKIKRKTIIILDQINNIKNSHSNILSYVANSNRENIKENKKFQNKIDLYKYLYCTEDEELMRNDSEKNLEQNYGKKEEEIIDVKKCIKNMNKKKVIEMNNKKQIEKYSNYLDNVIDKINRRKRIENGFHTQCQFFLKQNYYNTNLD